ncbi:hypothetical protein DB347_02135 [Opitutaceae bacterium EW11]|nr:hypothetical protein DB347_02135 [Opitutaceae bacterium EW11]
MNTPAFLSLFVLAVATASASPEDKLAAAGLALPNAAAPVANYVPAVRSGNLLFVSGQLPRDDSGKIVTGKLGRDLDEAAGVRAARQATLAALATLKAELGDLRRVRRVVRVSGYVNSTGDFTRQPAVVNGASDLLVAVFGEAGKHARAAIGVASLPLGAAVEVELVVEVSD